MAAVEAECEHSRRGGTIDENQDSLKPTKVRNGQKILLQEGETMRIDYENENVTRENVVVSEQICPHVERVDDGDDVNALQACWPRQSGVV